MAEVTLHVGGMTCGHCEETVVRALRTVDGVSSASVDLETGTAAVTYDERKTGPDALVNAITEAGYEAGTGAVNAAATMEKRGGGCCCH